VNNRHVKFEKRRLAGLRLRRLEIEVEKGKRVLFEHNAASGASAILPGFSRDMCSPAHISQC
jgi:hypothetical protein